MIKIFRSEIHSQDQFVIYQNFLSTTGKTRTIRLSSAYTITEEFRQRLVLTGEGVNFLATNYAGYCFREFKVTCMFQRKMSLPIILESLVRIIARFWIFAPDMTVRSNTRYQLYSHK